MLTFTDLQSRFLGFVSKNIFFDNFYLSGGTALSAVYYHHRESEDLDFFNYQEFSDRELLGIIKTSKNDLKGDKCLRSQSHGINYYHLVWDEHHQLKLDFNYFNFKQLEKPKIVLGIKVDSLLDIVVNKFEVLLMRGASRDYIDLYFLMTREGYSINDVIALHRKKFEIEIDEMSVLNALTNVNLSDDLPRMKLVVDFKKVRKFYFDLSNIIKHNI